MNQTISIIIPLYNVEQYVEKCLTSIFQQKYKNLELILIDDCSRDGTLNVVQKLCEGRENITILKNEKNQGLAYTRNRGLKVATGEYISFIDSDDYINETFYESMLESIHTGKASLAVCDIIVMSEESANRVKCGGSSRVEFIDCGLAASACNKLFHKKLLDNVTFDEGKINEDLAVVLPLLIETKKVVYNQQAIYYYVQRDFSIQNSAITIKRMDIFDAVFHTLEKLKTREFDDYIIYNQLIMFLFYVIPKEKSFVLRQKLLNCFYKHLRGLRIDRNSRLVKFYQNLGIIQRKYYQLLVKNMIKGHFLIVNSLMQLYYNYSQIKHRIIIPKKIGVSDIEKYARKQLNMKPSSVRVSVVIPNYNYKKFFLERMYSILYQTKKIHEIIVLDDCSTDGSQSYMDDICEMLSPYITIRRIYNETNSGSPFKQWEKGFQQATGDYVWIAEADDFCSKNLLAENLKYIKNSDSEIIIAYTNTSFITSTGNICIKNIASEIDQMKTGHWDQDYVISGKEEYQKYSFLNCTIANVSSTLIKKGNYEKEFAISGEYRQAGDWIFYVNVMQKGMIAYSRKTLNYYRVHGTNVSTMMKKENHLKEIERIHDFYQKEYGLDKHQKKEIEKRYKYLKRVWELVLEEGGLEDEQYKK